MHKKLSWIGRTIEQMVADIEHKYGAELRKCCNGQKSKIDIPGLVTRHFGVQLSGAPDDLSSIQRDHHKGNTGTQEGTMAGK